MTNLENERQKMEKLVGIARMAATVDTGMSPERRIVIEGVLRLELERLRNVLSEDIISEMLREVKSVSQESNPPSRPVLCVKLIQDAVVSPLIGQAMRNLDQGKNDAFAARFLLAQGINNISLIGEAETRVSLGAEASAREIAEEVLEFNGPNTALDSYLDSLEETERASALLIKDPSGFSLLDASLERLRHGELGKFVLIGAEFGVELYKRTYQIAEARNI